MIKKLFLPLSALVALAALFWVGLNRDPHHLQCMLLNQPVPSFSLPTNNAEKTFCDGDLKGKAALIHFWASWCASCRAEHEFLLKVASKKLPIYSILYKDDIKTTQDWLSIRGNPYQVLADDHEGHVAINFGVYGTPETFLIDQTGIIRFHWTGPLNRRIWREEILPRIESLGAQ